MKEIVYERLGGFILMGLTFNILPNLNVEFGVIGSLFQGLWILMGYLFSIKSGKRRNLPPLYYLAATVLSFAMCVFLTEPVHELIQGTLKWDVHVLFIIFTIALLAEYSYEIINKLLKMLESLIPDLREYLANKIKPKSDD
jgi:hypothetical protein